MPIRSRLPELRLARNRATLLEVSEETGIAMSTLSKFDRSRTTRIEFDVLEKLCRYFGVGPGELLHVVSADQMPIPRGRRRELTPTKLEA